MNMKVESFRDVLLLPVSQEDILILSCDSAGGIGEKSEDVVKTSSEIVGYFTARVTLAEILALGARPITVVDALAVEMEPTGRKILQGIQRAIHEIGLDEDIALNGSTEENFPTCQTGIGITALGIIPRKDFRKKRAQKGCHIVLVGKPLVGQEVLDEPQSVLHLKDISNLQKHPKVLEILPVGSKGIRYEIREMAKDNALDFTIGEDIKISLDKSGGPATCAIMAVKDDVVEELISMIQSPLTVLGRFQGGVL